jgi:Domain of unknown function (DUF1998)
MLEIALEDGRAAQSVAAGLEQGIQVAFQVDSSELASYVFADDEGGPARVLLYETDEGGIGVLAALARGEGWARLIDTTLRALHVDPESGEDDPGACATACYDCLLTFYNQQYHRILDRRPVVELLCLLRGATFAVTTPEGASYEVLIEHAKGIEPDVLKLMRARGLPAPGEQHRVIKDADAPVAEADLYYPDQRICVMCDGTPHDQAGVSEQDELKRKRLKALGYRVVVIRYDDVEDGVNKLAARLGY